MRSDHEKQCSVTDKKRLGYAAAPSSIPFMHVSTYTLCNAQTVLYTCSTENKGDPVGQSNML